MSPTFDCELTDIEAWCAYGIYFAGKLRGGVALATARAKGDITQQRVAVAALEQALVHWKRLAELGAKFNQLPVLSNSRQPFSWASLTPAVEKDIESPMLRSLQQDPPKPFPDPIHLKIQFPTNNYEEASLLPARPTVSL